MKKGICLFVFAVWLITALCGCGQAADPDASLQKGATSDATQIDFFDAVYHIGISGYNGQGRVWDMGYSVDYIDYDKENTDITAFLKTVKVDYPKEGLSNGDTLTLTLSYSQSTAEELGIQLTSASKSYAVFGLLEANTPPASVEKVNAKAMASALQKQLPAGDRIIAAYGYHFRNRSLCKEAGETAGGTYAFPAGYAYCNNYLDDGGVRYLYSIDFVVAGSTGYYLCEAGVKADGTQYGAFSVYHRRFENEAALMTNMENWGGKDALMKLAL